MTLLDIGNTTVSVWQNDRSFRISAKDFSWDEFPSCYYICVNTNCAAKLTSTAQRINLEPYFVLNSNYRNLGVDRAASAYIITDGIIIDAGSAITVDFMRNGFHLGGFILPGLQAFLRAYSSISPRLNMDLNKEINLNVLPNNTKDAISFGIVNAISASINKFATNAKIYLTGGDSEFLNNFINEANLRPNLVFEGMLKLIKDKNL